MLTGKLDLIYVTITRKTSHVFIMYIYYITYEDAFSRHGFSMEQPHRTPQTELTVETLYYFAS